MNVGALLLLAAGAWLVASRARGPVPPPGAPGEPEVHTVQPGESLSIIARDQLGDLERWRELAELNGINPPYVIYPGQSILLPAR